MTDFQIIYLNGPSSSGKTTLARALQNKLKIPYLILGIDQIIFMMPEKLNDWHNETKAPGFSWQSVKDADEKVIAYKIHTGPFGKKLDQALKDIVVTLAKSDFHVIIDDVSLEGAKSVDKWRITLKDFNVLWIGVTAPLEILELREKKRSDRKIGSARWQVAHVHSGVIYDLMIDTHAKSLYENINAITCLIEYKIVNQSKKKNLPAFLQFLKKYRNGIIRIIKIPYRRDQIYETKRISNYCSS